MEKFLSTPEAVVYRKVMNELVVIQLHTGQMFHFSEGTQDLLNHFKKPKTLDSYLTATEIGGMPAEVEHVKALTSFLLHHQLLEETSVRSVEDIMTPHFPYSRPQFLRLDAKTLDEVVFLYP